MRECCGHGVDQQQRTLPRIADDIGSIADPIGFNDWGFRKTPPWERGYADGLRAGYEAALAAGVMTAAAEPTPTAETTPSQHGTGPELRRGARRSRSSSDNRDPVRDPQQVREPLRQ